MTYFTDSPFEKMMIQKPGGKRDKSPPASVPRRCEGCPYKGQAPCFGYCFRKIEKDRQPER